MIFCFMVKGGMMVVDLTLGKYKNFEQQTPDRKSTEKILKSYFS